MPVIPNINRRLEQATNVPLTGDEDDTILSFSFHKLSRDQFINIHMNIQTGSVKIRLNADPTDLATLGSEETIDIRELADGTHTLHILGNVDTTSFNLVTCYITGGE